MSSHWPLYIFPHILGLGFALYAILRTRTPQGATGWALSLLLLPYFSIPLFLVFGQHKYRKYISGKNQADTELSRIRKIASEFASPFISDLPVNGSIARKLSLFPTTRGNQIEILPGGEAFFEKAKLDILKAEKNIFFLFYTVEDGELLNQFLTLFKTKISEGVQIYFLVDEIGSGKLSPHTVEKIKKMGIQFRKFGAEKKLGKRFQINFRNHRKILCIDQKVTYFGGINIADEYLHLDQNFGYWRDSQFRLVGPANLGFELTFLEDWAWATGECQPLNIEWPVLSKKDWREAASPAETSTNSTVTVLPSGPADPYETMELHLAEIIMSAEKRVWLSSPYFVPGKHALSALQSAALRGIEVKILTTNQADHYIVHLAGISYLAEAQKHGCQAFRYKSGFLHQKALLIDDRLATVGSANFDNRSMRLNFEISAVVESQPFASAVEKFLEEDFRRSQKISRDFYRSISIRKKLLVESAKH